MAPSKSEGSKSSSSSSTVYTLIFFLAFVTWFIARKQEGYSKWVEHSRAQEWVTAEGMQHRRQIASSEGGEGETGGDESPSEGDSSSSSSSSSSGEKDGAKDKDEEKGERDDAEGDGGDEDSAVSTESAPKIDEMERAREELAILERAVIARSEEERLYTELMNTRTIQGQLQDPPPPGPADYLFMANIEKELATLTQKWIAEFADIKSIQRDPEEAKTADETLKKLADWQDRWEKRELERLLQERKEKIGFTTLTGRVASSTSSAAGRNENNAPRGAAQGGTAGGPTGGASKDSAEKKSQSTANSEEGDAQGGAGDMQTAAAAAGAAESGGGVEGKDNDYGIDAATPHRVVVPHLTSTGNPLSESDAEELLATLRSLETNAMQWTESSKKQIVVLGERVYISRDMGVYKWAFTRLGFNVKSGPSSTGRMSTKLLSSGDWSVLLCLALNTEHCFTSTALDRTKRYQRVNRVQGLRRVLWSKDSFCETVSASARGSTLFGKYIFDCWIFPREYTAAAAYAQSHPKSQFIVKPLSMGGGMGISVVDGERGLHKVRRQTHIVQNYLHNPMLIKGKKWDLRTYVLVTSVLPLRGYVYNRGLVRFASQAYDPSAKHGGKRTQFLTNTSVNKHYVKKGNVTDITWAFEQLKAHLDSVKPGTYNKLLSRMQAAISIVMLSAERSWRKYFDGLGGEMCGNCYQLMGVDLIVDADLQPRVIEVNGQPSMQLTKSEEDHYTTTKRNMIRDLTTLVYNEDRVAADLTKELSSLDREIVTQLQTRDHEYLLEYHREKQAMGGWLPVYPSFRHYHLHEVFFKYQKNPPTEESRMTLHHILGALEQRLFDSGGPKPREQRTHTSQSDDDEDGPVIDDEGIIVDDESNEAAGDD